MHSRHRRLDLLLAECGSARNLCGSNIPTIEKSGFSRKGRRKHGKVLRVNYLISISREVRLCSNSLGSTLKSVEAISIVSLQVPSISQFASVSSVFKAYATDVAM